MLNPIRRPIFLFVVASQLIQLARAAPAGEAGVARAMFNSLFTTEALATVPPDGSSKKMLPGAPSLSNLTLEFGQDLIDRPHAGQRILGVPQRGPAQPGEPAEWNDTDLWLNAVVSESGARLAAAVRSRQSSEDRDVAYIVEYDRDPRTGELSHGQVVGEASESILLGRDLAYAPGDRITYFLTEVEKFDTPNDGPRYSAIYLLMQRSSYSKDEYGNSKLGRIYSWNGVAAYQDSPYVRRNWMPKLSPDGKDVLYPILRYRRNQKNGTIFLMQSSIFLGKGRWMTSNDLFDKQWVVLEASPKHRLTPFLEGERSSAHYRYAANGKKIWVVGGNDLESFDRNRLQPWGNRNNVWIPHSGFVSAPEALMSAALLDSYLDQYDWSFRARTTFKNAGIETFRQLSQLHLNSLSAVNGIGRKVIEEIRIVLASHGIRLYGDEAASLALALIPTEPNLPAIAVLPAKYWQVVVDAGITTYDELRKLTENDLIAIPGIKKSWVSTILGLVHEREEHALPGRALFAA